MATSSGTRVKLATMLGNDVAGDMIAHLDGTSTDAQPFAGDVTVAGTLTANGALVANGALTMNGAFSHRFVAASADGAITIKSGVVYVTKAGVCAMTIADPTATTDDGKILTIISTTANAHTLDNSAGSGFNAGGGSKDVGTFGGAKGDGITITAYQGKWYVIGSVNVTLG